MQIQLSCQALDWERRSTPRIDDPIQITVRGVKENGEPYRFKTTAGNIGAGGLYAAAPRIMKPGEKLAMRIRFALAGTNPVQAPSVSRRATVLRVEDCGDGSCQFAVSFQK